MDKKKRRFYFRTGMLIVMLLAIGFTVYQSFDSDESAAFSNEGERAQNFKLNTIEGDSLELNSLEGDLVLVNFWGTWCEPCKREMPAIQSAYENYQDDGFQVVSVNVGESQFVTSKFVSAFDLTFPVLLDQGRDVQGRYKVGNLPATFLVDREGVIREVHEGELKEDHLESWIDEYL